MDITSRTAFAPRVPWRTIVVALLALTLVVGAALAYVGSQQRRLPAPFGPAANGVVPYVSGGDIYVGDPISGTTELLVGGPEADALPQFSPDGTHIAFIRDIGAAGSDGIDLYVVRDDGSDLRRITTEPIDRWEWIGWTPDGRSLAVVHGEEPRLDLFDADGSGTVRQLVSAAGMTYAQFRPPDGREIMYRALVESGWGLFALDVQTSTVRELVAPTVPTQMDMAFFSATYSPDGRRIFYEHADETGCCRLWVMNADGTDKHEFLPRGPAWDGQASVSPDGRWVAYWHNPNGGPDHGVSVVRTDGAGSPIETGPKLPDTADWVWAPDSSKILMFPNNVPDARAYLLDPAGGPWMTVPWGSDGDIDWQRLAPSD